MYPVILTEQTWPIKDLLHGQKKNNVFLQDQSRKSRLNKLGSFFNDHGDGNERLAKKKNCT